MSITTRSQNRFTDKGDCRRSIYRIYLSLPVTVLAGILLVGCNDDNQAPVAVSDGTFDNTDAVNERVGTLTSRDLEPVASDEAVAAVSLAQRRFALDMHRALSAELAEQNLVFSPYSMSTALAMTLGGTTGASNSALANVLHLEEVDTEELHQAVNRLDLAVMGNVGEVEADNPDNGRTVVEEEDPIEVPQLTSSNRLFMAAESNLQEEYLDLAMGQYGAPVTEADFVNQAEEVVSQINNWVSVRTDGRIEQLVDSASAQTKAILVNALLLASEWEEPYEYLESRTFNTPDGSLELPSFGRFGGSMKSLIEDDLQAVELPYVGDQLSLVLIHPTDLSSYEQGLDEMELQRVLDQMQSRTVNFTAPIWSSEFTIDARDLLISLGMPSGDMNFSAMLAKPGPTELAIGKVQHAAAIEVDEFGTVAAATTAVDLLTGSTPGPSAEPTRINVDSPFLYVIMDRVNQVILFSGHVSDPRG